MANIKTGKTTGGVAGIAREPRSFADYVAGKSTVKYTRPIKPTQETVNKAFKSYGPTSNGKGVGM